MNPKQHPKPLAYARGFVVVAGKTFLPAIVPPIREFVVTLEVVSSI